MSENVLDEENWKIEANAVINDIKHHVKNVTLTTKLQCSDEKIYFNLTTLENKDYCIELSALGFCIVGNCHDCNNLKHDEYFETPYSLLNSISSLFKISFGNELIQKLEKISNE